MNTQINEDFVSFEVAKLLKEKEFDWECSHRFDSDGIFRDIQPTWNWNMGTNRYSAPTLQMAMKWLREVHNLHICIFIGEDSSCDADGNTVDMWHFWSYNVTNLCGYIVYDAYAKFDCVEYQSYEGACEAAIKYCLTNLI